MILILGHVASAAPLQNTPDTIQASEAIPFLPEWRLLDRIQLQFDAFHTQGLVKIGNRFFLSAVEVLNRGRGIGVGHLYEFDDQGALLRHITLGEGPIYHPGGIDYDGKFLWIPVAEYRKDSSAIIYKVDPKTFEATEAFRVKDHVSNIIFNHEFGTLVGQNWDSRYFYEWTLDGTLIRKTKNEIDSLGYQDCKYLEGPAMICTGKIGNARGSLDLIDLLDFTKIDGLRFIPRTPKLTLMTRNAMAIEKQGSHILYYFLPEDNHGPLFIYELR